MKDYYSVLGVSKDADEVVIRAAYKGLAQKYHPDKAPPELKSKYTALMTLINEAYVVLGDSGKRLKYDLRQAKQTNPETNKENNYSKTVDKKNVSIDKEYPVWLVSLVLAGVWAIGLYLIFKYIVFKD